MFSSGFLDHPQVGGTRGVVRDSVPFDTFASSSRCGDEINDASNDTYSSMMPDGTRRPHPYTGFLCGTSFGPDGPLETNHSGKCREDYAGLSGCFEIAGLNVSLHEQNHVRKGVHLRSFNSLTFPYFASSLQVFNDLQSDEYNGKPLRNRPHTMAGHSKGRDFACWCLLLRSGKCFCSNPVTLVFDRFGRVDVLQRSSIPQKVSFRGECIALTAMGVEGFLRCYSSGPRNTLFHVSLISVVDPCAMEALSTLTKLLYSLFLPPSKAWAGRTPCRILQLLELQGRTNLNPSRGKV